MDILDHTLLNLERAAGDLRRGIPIVVKDGKAGLVIMPAEMAAIAASRATKGAGADG